ncbi:MAG: STAS domain-containing protein [Alphaproteobacteria bacterium]|nr:STAS domain-containing protein [Alphaproteobacteria bacterium]
MTSRTEILLGSRLDLNAAEALQGEILSQRDGVQILAVDGSEVSLVDTPAIQVLLAAAHDHQARGGQFELREPSPAFEEAMQLLGLDAQLEKWRGINE